MFLVHLIIKQECFQSFHDSIKRLTGNNTALLTDLYLDATYKSSIIFRLASKRSVNIRLISQLIYQLLSRLAMSNSLEYTTYRLFSQTFIKL